MFFLVLVCALMQVPNRTGDFLLAKGRAGSIEIGMTVDELLARVGHGHTTLVDLHLEGMFTPALAVRLPGGEGVVHAEIGEQPCEGFRIWRLAVEDARFRTSEGIGVGSTYGQVLARYDTQPPADGEGDVYVFVPALEMSFGFGSAWYSRARELPASARVTTVLVLLSKEIVRQQRCPLPGPIR